MRRVAVVTNQTLGPNSTPASGFISRYRLLVNGLAAAGDALRVIEFGPGRRAPASSSGWFGGETLEHLIVDSGRQGDHAAGPVERVVRAAGLVAGFVRWAAPWEREVRELIDDWDPDVVLVMTPFRPEALLLVPRRIPSVYFAEEDFSGYLARQRSKSIAEAVLRWAKRDVVVISDAEVGWAKGRFPRSRVHVVRHAVDAAYWRPATPSAEPTWDAFCVGDFAQPRNHEGLVRICSALQGDDRRWSLGVASARPLPADAREALGPTVQELGAVEDVRPLYEAAGVVLVPAFEVSGVKTQVLQGWAVERPVVATSAAARSVGGVNGRHLVSGDTAEEVAAALRKVVSDATLARTCVEGGRERLQSEFSVGAAVHSLQTTIDQALR